MTSQQQAEAARDRGGVIVGAVVTPSAAVDTAQVWAPTWALSATKRVLDIVLSLLLLPFVIVVVFGAGVISMCVFRTWPLFFQQRRGRDERPFRTVKIRSLPRSFPDQQGKLGLDLSSQGRWSAMLRHSHVDELPQVFNVLTGSMSLVGPRPMIDDVLDFLRPEQRAERALVRPGLTGAWQVSTAGARPLQDCTALDAAYVRECSFPIDLRIIWWTVLVVLRRRSFTPDRVLDELSN